MKTFSVRRFTTVEIVYHTIQLVLYLILFVSGGMILLQRLFEVEIVGLAVPAKIHRVTGFVLIAFIVQIIVISVFSKNFRPLWETFLDAFKWLYSDIIWLIKMLSHAFDSRVKLPPSGRFNPGQKLHLLVVYLLLLVYASTGLIMIFVPGSLGPWVVHAICFAPSVLFLAIHLFLSIINPPTRKAIKGIVTGYVPLDYAREHHALWQKSEDPVSHTSQVSLPAVMLAILALVAVLVSVTWYAGFDRVKLQIIKIANNGAREALLPGLLISAHAEEPDAKQCTSCHNYLNSPPASKCLKCHQEILAVINNNQGYHGALMGQCRTCHTEHKGLQADITSLDVKDFNHENARFSLEGKHRDLECRSCHKQQNKNNELTSTKFIGLPFETCTECHRNPHPDSKDNYDCLACHTMDGWTRKQLIFDHNQNSKYKLEGEHIAISCEKCHFTTYEEKVVSQVKLINIGSKCIDCHDDIHKGQFQKECQSCHSEHGWKGTWLVDSHGADSAYPLNGMHNKLKCIECHKLPHENAKLAESKLAGLSHECSSCHDDIHNGQMNHTCEICHNEHGWKGRNLLFDHNQHSLSKLDNLHAHVSCNLCHLPDKDKIIRYSPLPQQCDTCHTDIVDFMNGKLPDGNADADPHAERVTCVDCHTTDIAKQLPHQYAEKCADCHNPRYYGLYFDWQKSIAHGLKISLQLIKNLEGNDNDQKERITAKIKIAEKIGFHNIQLSKILLEGNSLLPSR
ncbi:MAG: cytochrome b/b6 domain-containing protein [Planctomycetes bacterium]|uniref:cytochrome b/b6 domain-containing protein n=1 Tax=Candidatus Wunengus californicus TaxID=3367619 RepID=UPI0040263E74|nr:cytochrome b/b6 domain-containing protein [Planctomycetota bacterium]